MNRQPVRSDAVQSAGYDPDARVLEIEFGNGRVYQYVAVAPSVYEWFLRARSKGTYITRVLKNYEYRDVTKPDESVDLIAALEASLGMPELEARPLDDTES